MTTLLHNEHITLRAIEPEDLELLYTIENDTDLWKFGVANVPYSHYALKQFVANTTHDIYADRQARLIICSSANQEVMGMVDLFSFDPVHLRAEVGILILKPYQGKGFGSMALNMLCEYAQKRLHIHQLYAYSAVENTQCARAFEAAHFKMHATLPDWIRTESGFNDANLFLRIF